MNLRVFKLGVERTPTYYLHLIVGEGAGVYALAGMEEIHRAVLLLPLEIGIEAEITISATARAVVVELVISELATIRP